MAKSPARYTAWKDKRDKRLGRGKYRGTTPTALSPEQQRRATNEKAAATRRETAAERTRAAASAAQPDARHTPAVRAALHDIEPKSVRLGIEELTLVHQKTGKVLFSKRGTPTSVPMERGEVARFYGAVGTHNHPNLGYAESQSLSLPDWHFAAAYGLAAFRAVGQGVRGRGPDYVYEIRRPARGWPANYFDEVIKPAYERAMREVREDLIAAAKAARRSPGGRLSSKRYLASEYSHAINERVAAATGITYTRIPYTAIHGPRGADTLAADERDKTAQTAAGGTRSQQQEPPAERTRRSRERSPQTSAPRARTARAPARRRSAVPGAG